MKKIFTNQLILLVASLFVSVTANAHSTHYGKAAATANPSGAGKVYVSTNQNATSGNDSETFNCGGNSGSDSKTYYFFAQTTNNAYYFDGWYEAASGGSRITAELKCSATVKATSTSSNSPTTVNRYARWIAKTTPTVTAPTAKSLTYTGSAQALLNAGSADGGTLEYSADGTNYSTTIPSGTNAGDYTVYYKVTGDAKHLDVAAQSLAVTIAKAASSVNAPTAVEGLVYDGTAQKLVNAGSATGGELQYSLDGVNYSTALPEATNADDYTVSYKVVGNDNYNGIDAANLSVSIAKAALTVKADDKKIFFGDDAPAYTATISGWQGSDDESVLSGTLAFACEYEAGKSVGTYTIEPSGVSAANYDIDFQAGTLSVNKPAAVVTTAPVAMADLAYTGAAQTLINDAEAAVTGGTLVYSLDGENYDAELPKATDAKTYTVYYYAKADADHSDSEAQTIEVTVAKVTLTVTAEDKNVTYGEAAPEYTVTYNGFVGEETASVLTGELAIACEYAAGSAVNTYAITPSGLTAGNYELNFVAGTLTVAKATLTVTAEDKNVTYGEAAPEYTVAYSGFIGEDTESVLSGELAFACEYAASSAVNTYAITPSGLTAANYELDFVAGTLTVAKAALTVTADDKNVTYGEAAPEYTVAYSGFVGEDTESVLTGELAFACEYAAGSAVNTYVITPSGLTAANYELDFVAGTLTVAKAAPAVTAPVAIEGLAYTGEAQTLIAAGEADGGEMQYSLDGENYSTDLPKGTEVAEYTVYYLVIGDANHTDVAAETIQANIAKANAVITTAPTAAENLAYTGEAQALLATAGEATGGELQYSLDNETFAAVLPVGTNAGEYTVYYKVVADASHSDVTGEPITVIIAKVDAAITAVPTAAENLTYTGEAQALLATAGEATGGELQYSLDNETFAAVLPVGTNADNYTVYYKVAGDQNHNDVAGESIAVSIAKADAVIATAPTAAENLTYTGEAQALLATAGEATGGELQYSLDNETFAAALPVGTNADDYTVYYKVAGDQNHNDVAGESIPVSIAKANAVITTAPTAAENLTYTGEAQALLATAGEATGGELQYSLDNETFAAALPVGTNADDYTVYYKVAGDQNHNDVAGEPIALSIAKADVVFATEPAAIEGLKYTGEAQTLITAGEAAGVTVLYSLDGENFSAELPSAINAGNYTVSYKVDADNNHNAYAVATVDAAIAKTDVVFVSKPAEIPGLVFTGEAQVLITAGETADGQIEYSLDGENYSAELPTATAIGDYTVYYRVIGDANHNDVEAATLAARIAAGNASVVTAPVAIEGLAYTGEAQTLIAAGVANGGEMLYSLDGENYAAELPQATNAGEYTVYYFVKGDADHSDTEVANVAVTIAKADAVLLSAPQAVELLIENGSEQALVTEGTAEGGLLVYSTDGENFSAELPVAVEAGEYTVYYYVDADDNHNDTELAQLIVTIAPAGPATAVENTNAQIIVKKIIRNDQVLIIRDGKIYTVQGYEVR